MREQQDSALEEQKIRREVEKVKMENDKEKMEHNWELKRLTSIQEETKRGHENILLNWNMKRL